MPYCYYLIPETADIIPEKPIHGWSKSRKPETYDLLLPSIHASRGHNVLQTGDPLEAVADLLAAYHDSTAWPSSRYSCNSQNPIVENSQLINREADVEPPQAYHNVDEIKQEYTPEVVLPKLPVYAKYRLPFWSQDITDPNVIDAARSLFFERRKQQVVYGTAFPSWENPSRTLRMPTDYELFVAWASLPRSEKMLYISEVTGDWSVGSSQLPTNTLETERAVNALYSSCPDAVSWPSLEYQGLQQPRTHLRVPHLLHHLPLPYQREGDGDEIKTNVLESRKRIRKKGKVTSVTTWMPGF